MGEQDLDSALDAEDPKKACIKFINDRSNGTSDFSKMSMSELRHLMQKFGASDEDLDSALDANDPRQACINFLMANQGGRHSAPNKETTSELRKKAVAAG